MYVKSLYSIFSSLILNIKKKLTRNNKRGNKKFKHISYSLIYDLAISLLIRIMFSQLSNYELICWSRHWIDWYQGVIIEHTFIVYL